MLSVLEEYNKTAKEQLKNARNAVAGAIRNLDPKITEERKCEINFYDINYIQDNNLINSQQQAINFFSTIADISSPHTFIAYII